MGRRKKARIISFFVALAVLAGIGVYCYAHGIGEREVVADTSYFVEADGSIAVPPGGNSTEARMTRGNSEENPFFGLEIVPYEECAEFGYLIEGCEPIDFSVYDNRGNMATYHRREVIYTEDDIPRLLPAYEVKKELVQADAEQFGTMTRVADGTGEYRQIPTVCEYTLGSTGTHKKAVQYNTGLVDENGATTYYNNKGDIFVTFRYDPDEAGVMRYSAVENTKLSGKGYYSYYTIKNGHWEYCARGTDSATPDFYIGNGTHYVVFVPDEYGEYVVDRVLGSASSGQLKQVLAMNPSMQETLKREKLQSAIYEETEGYIKDANGLYSRKVVKAFYKKVGEGKAGADFVWSPLGYHEGNSLAEWKKQEYRTARPEGTSFLVARKNVTFYKGYLHDNTFLTETLDLGYEMIDGVRTKITDEKRVEDRIANYHAVVYTVTPEDLNQNLGLIDRADIISISAKNKVGSTIEMYQRFRREDLFSRANTPAAKAVKNFYVNENNKATFCTNQLDWDTALRIYQRVTEDECTCPIIIDTIAYKSVGPDGHIAGQKANVSIPQTYGDGTTRYENGTGYSNNLYKLFLLLNQMKKEVFTSLYGELTGSNFSTVNTGQTEKDGSPIKTCVFTKWNLPASAPTAQINAMKYWNEWTFLPYELMPAYGQHHEAVNSLAIMNSYGDTIYHYDSGDAQNMLTGNLYVFPTDNLMTTEFSNMDANGLKNNQYGHEAYEYFDSVNGDEEGEPANLGTARSLHYIWRKSQGGANQPGVKTFRVLELEPSSRYVKSDVAWKSFIANYCGTDADVIVERMTTAEFNGRHMDLQSKYDLVYVGVNKDTSDVTMQFGGGQEYLYAHTGPGLTLNHAELKGLLGQPSVENRFVFSGNDLTRKAKEQLLVYAKEGFPVMFGTGFYTGPDASLAVAGIDRNSNVYALSAEMKATPETTGLHIYEGAFTGGVSYHLAEAEKFKDALAKEQVTLTVSEQPVEYDSAIIQYSQKYITSGVLRYRFKVNTDPTEEFEVCLWTDLNRDGVFSAEELAQTEIYPIDESGVQGAKLAGTQILGGTTYLVISPLPEMTGGIHWKLAVIKNGAVQASLSGVSAVRSGSRKEIKVLQIVPEASSSCRIFLPQEGEVVGNTVQIPGLTTAQKQVTKLIWEYSEALTEYKLKFVRMTEQEAAAVHGANPNTLSGQYDIMVLGFADSYTDTYGTAIQETAEKFFSVGKSVVYTPDVLALPGADAATGGYAKRFRQRFGADRYGITALSSGGRATELIHAYANHLSSDIPKATSSSSATGYVTVSAGGTDYLLAQGISNAVLYRYLTGPAGNVTTTKAAKINKGLITEYPYTCGELLTVSGAHAPYYQLDLEKETSVVWYCMAESGGGTASDSYLKKSENDVRNHGYVYSTGSVVYAGIGSGGSLTTDEVKLLINALVAAYREAPDSARVLIENADAAKEGDTYHLCVDVDSGQKDKLMGADCASSYFVRESGTVVEKTGESKKLFLRIKDGNIYPTGTTAEYSMKFETESGGSYIETKYAVYDMTGALVTDLQANTPYYTFVKVTTENTASGPAIGQTKLRISVTLRCYEAGTETYSCEDIKNVEIIPRGFFNLD